MAKRLMKKISPNTGYDYQSFVYDVDYSSYSKKYLITMSAFWKGKLCLLCTGEETFEIKGKLSVKRDGSNYSFFETERNDAVKGALTQDQIEMIGDLIDIASEVMQETEVEPASSGHQIKFNNKCHRKISLAIEYRYNSKDWTTKYWYSIDPYENTFLSSNGNILKTNNRIIYYYATIPDTEFKWSGNESRYFDGNYYKMKEYTMTQDADGNLVISLTCSNVK